MGSITILHLYSCGKLDDTTLDRAWPRDLRDLVGKRLTFITPHQFDSFKKLYFCVEKCSFYFYQ